MPVNSISHRHTAGFTLIEVLVSVLILAVGLLGLSAMQLSSLKINQGAYHRSQALMLANDIIERMRANPEAYEDGAYDDIDSESEPPEAQDCVTDADGCDKDEIAAQDIREWMGNFVDVSDAGVSFVPVIPGGAATVVRDEETGLATVTISWQQEGWAASTGVNDDETVSRRSVQTMGITMVTRI